MLRSDLIELINGGEAWAFVGSGVSVDSNYPSWAGVIEGLLPLMDAETRKAVESDDRFRTAFKGNDYPRALSRLERLVGKRDWLEAGVTAQLKDNRPSGPLVREIANWPFRGYITTNYDELIERALEKEVGERGWLPVGNTEEENRKVSGDTRQIVWHIHGGIDLTGKSNLVLTEDDYDRLYLNSSHLTEALKGLIRHRRVIFIGFGFEDKEVMRLIKSVGRWCNPAQPAFAFLSGLSGSRSIAKREELLDRYNVDVIPYAVVDGSHHRLLDLLQTYGPLLLGRNLHFGRPQRECPSYDPQTTALLLYNQLVLAGQAELSEQRIGQLVKAQLLAMLRYRDGATINQLAQELAERVRLISDRDMRDTSDAVQTVTTHVRALVASGLADAPDDFVPDQPVTLTKNGADLIGRQSAEAELIGQQFSMSLLQRSKDALADDEEAASRVAAAVESFLKDCIEKRAVGVARAWRSPLADLREYHMTALLQALPQFIQELNTPDEGRGLVKILQEIFAKPTEVEATFMGVALQAQFGVNLLGYSPKLLESRIRQISKTLFLIDSTTLIPFLARSGVGQEAASQLISRLQSVGAAVASTDLLGVEVAEHAGWALKQVGHAATHESEKLLDYATGRVGVRRNLFLDGYLDEIAEGKGVQTFGKYLDSVCGNARGHTGAEAVFLDALAKLGIKCPALKQWGGFKEGLWAARQELEEEISARRMANGTYQHERQVRAEADAVIVIRSLRDGTFQWDDKEFENAYFISNTGIVDDLGGTGLPVTMRPHSVLQWVGTLTGCTTEEMRCLINGLLWELSQGGGDFIDYGRIEKVFYGLIHAAKERLKEESDTHRLLIGEEYGEDAEAAYSSVRDVDLPVVLRSYFAQKAVVLEQQVKLERKTREAAEKQALLREEDAKALARFRQKQEEKARKRKTKRRRPG